MKKLLILTVSFLPLYHIANAQTDKGTQTLGVNLSFTTSKTNDLVSNSSGTTMNSNTYHYWSAGPNYSYFIADKLDIGGSFIYNSNTTNYFANATNTTKLLEKKYGGEVFLRKYYMCSEKFGFRAGPYLEYTRGTQNQDYNMPFNTNGSQDKTDNYSAGVTAELVYYPSKHLGVSATLANLNYQHTKETFQNPDIGHGTTNQVNFNFMNTLYGFSLFYVFGSKKG